MEEIDYMVEEAENYKGKIDDSTILNALLFFLFQPRMRLQLLVSLKRMA